MVEDDEVERRARQRLDALDSKHGLKLSEGRPEKATGKVSKRKSGRKRRRGSSVSSSEEEDEESAGPSSESEADDDAGRKSSSRGKRRKRGASSSQDEETSDGLTSDSDDKSRRHKREKKSGRKKEKEKSSKRLKVKGKKSRRTESGRDKEEDSSSKKSKDKSKSRDKLDSRHKKEKRSKHRKEKESSKKKVRDYVDEVVIPPQEDVAIAKILRTPLQDKMDAQEQQKAMIRHNAEMAKARLASGDMKRARDEQAEMQRLYGAVDWRAKKKLRSEKKRLERTIAAGNKLANLEEREMARMDAFRVALGLPTAEAQRQAEWRAEATRALAEQEATMKESSPAYNLLSARSNKHSVIGPRLPHRSPT